MDRAASTGRWFKELFPGADQTYWLDVFQSVVDEQIVRTFKEYWRPLDHRLGVAASPAGDGRYYVSERL